MNQKYDLIALIDVMFGYKKNCPKVCHSERERERELTKLVK